MLYGDLLVSVHKQKNEGCLSAIVPNAYKVQKDLLLKEAKF